MSDCGYCPGCQKLLVKQAPRTHLKQCASRLNMTLVDFLTLSSGTDPPRIHQAELKRFIPASCTAPDGTTDDDMQTAVALSLSVIEEDRQRQLEVKLGSKTHLADVGPPSHLLLSDEQRRVIFSDRLASIILQAKRVKAQSDRTDVEGRRYRKKCWSAPHLWNLASASTDNSCAQDAESSIPDELDVKASFYVNALIPPITPTTSKWGSNLLSLSQIPGRSTMKLEPRHEQDDHQMDDPPETMFVQSQGFFCDSNSASPLCCTSPLKVQSPQTVNRSSAQIPSSHSRSVSRNRFLTMLGQTTCSDGWLLLDTGESVPIHRFVFAAWNVLTTVFPDDSNTAFAPGVNREQLMELLHCLYRGDDDDQVFRQTVDKMSDPVKRLAKRWGFDISPNLQSPQLENPDLCDTLRQHSYPSSPVSYPNANPIIDDDGSSCPADFPARNPASEQRTWKYPTTPPMANSPSRAPNISPQFSRDLFSPIDDECYAPTTAMVSEADREEEEQMQISQTLHSTTTSTFTNSKPSPLSVDPIFDDQPTPCPLFKRLRLSADASPPEESSSAPAKPVAAITPEKSPSPNGKSAEYSLLFTPMGNSSLGKENIFSPNKQAPVNCLQTPLVERSTTSTCQTPVTPLPNYGEMMTPELKHALSNYGVRPLPRKRAVKLLNEIYNQLHQYEPHNRMTNFSEQKPPDPTRQNNHSSSTPNDPQSTARCDLPPAPSVTKKSGAPRPARRPVSSTRHKTTSSLAEVPTNRAENSSGIGEAGCYSSGNHASPTEPSPFEVHEPSEEESDGENRDHTVDLETAVLNVLQDNADLYRNILLYTPIEFDVVHAMLKESGIRISARKLMDILDEQCITFTLRNRKQGRSKPRSTKVIKKRATH